MRQGVDEGDARFGRRNITSVQQEVSILRQRCTDRDHLVGVIAGQGSGVEQARAQIQLARRTVADDVHRIDASSAVQDFGNLFHAVAAGVEHINFGWVRCHLSGHIGNHRIHKDDFHALNGLNRTSRFNHRIHQFGRFHGFVRLGRLHGFISIRHHSARLGDAHIPLYRLWRHSRFHNIR